mgnify:FL=1
MDLLYLDENKKLHRCVEGIEPTHVHMTIEEYNNLQSVLLNLKRICKEKSNQERNLKPKKERSGYILLGYDTNDFRMKFKESSVSFEARRLLIETPYSIGINYKEATNLIKSDLADMVLQFGAFGLIDKNNLLTDDMMKDLFKSDSDKYLIFVGLEAQRNGLWAARLFANFTPDVPVDLIKQNEKER